MLLLFFIIMIVLNVKIRKQKEIEKLNAILTTQENERKRIAEDMHDDIGPMLSAIKLQINSFTSVPLKEEFKILLKTYSSAMSLLALKRGRLRIMVGNKVLGILSEVWVSPVR